MSHLLGLAFFLTLTLFLTLFSPCLHAQHADTVKTRMLVGMRAHYGTILIHSRDLRPIKDSYPVGVEADVAWQWVNQKAWDFCNCYPRAGSALTFWNWDNREVLGYGVTLVNFVEPVFLTRHRINLSIRMGGGISYLTLPHDSITNPNNLSYSTHWNFPLMVNVGLHFRLNPHWSLHASAAYNHVSNGGVHLPNKGINYPTLGLGADYAFKAIDFKERAKRRDKSPPSQRLRLQIQAMYSFSNAEIADTRQYNIWGGIVKGVYYLGRWSGLTLGTEYVVDRSLKRLMEIWDVEGTHHRGAFLVGHQFLLGHVIFSQQLGIYYLDQWGDNDPVYQRYGLDFLIKNHVLVGFGVKAHRHVADFADVRLGWTF